MSHYHTNNIHDHSINKASTSATTTYRKSQQESTILPSCLVTLTIAITIFKPITRVVNRPARQQEAG